MILVIIIVLSLRTLPSSTRERLAYLVSMGPHCPRVYGAPSSSCLWGPIVLVSMGPHRRIAVGRPWSVPSRHSSGSPSLIRTIRRCAAAGCSARASFRSRSSSSAILLRPATGFPSRPASHTGKAVHDAHIHGKRRRGGPRRLPQWPNSDG